MTIPTPELATMKRDVSALINDWGVTCSIRRKAMTRNTAGQVSAAILSVGTEKLWIQPLDIGWKKSNSIEAGALDRGTHECWERFSGYAMQTNDQIVVPGDVYAYDVLSEQLVQTHRHLFLQQVKRV